MNLGWRTLTTSSFALSSAWALSESGMAGLLGLVGRIIHVRGCFFAIGSILSITPLLPLPERAEGAVLAVREVLALLMRAAHVALGHRHLLDAVLEEKVLQLLLHLGVGHHVCGHPPLHDRLGTVMQDHARRNLRGRPVVGAVQRHGADGVLTLLPIRSQVPVILASLAVAAVFVLFATAAGTGGVARELLAGHSAPPCSEVHGVQSVLHGSKWDCSSVEVNSYNGSNPLPP